MDVCLGLSTGLSCLLEGEQGGVGEVGRLERCALPAAERALTLTAIEKGGSQRTERRRELLWFSANNLSGWSVVCRRRGKQAQRHAGGLNCGFALTLLKYEGSLKDGDRGAGGISGWILGRVFQDRRNGLAVCCRALS